jgi:hypothetical protein
VTVVGVVVDVLVGDTESLRTRSVSSLDLDHDGILGDRHHGRFRKAGPRENIYQKGTLIPNNRQVSIVSQEELALIRAGMGLEVLDPAWLGANFVTRGIIDLSKVATSSRLFIGPDLVLVVHFENFPCGAPGSVIGEENPSLESPKKSFVQHARGLRGLVGWVERVGSVSSGMGIRVVPVSGVVS